VFFDPSRLGFTAADVHARLLQLPNPLIGGMAERVVVHHQINPQAVEDFIATVQEMKNEKGLVSHGTEGDAWAEEGQLRKEMALGY
jgi:threonine aldolase